MKKNFFFLLPLILSTLCFLGETSILKAQENTTWFYVGYCDLHKNQININRCIACGEWKELSDFHAKCCGKCQSSSSHCLVGGCRNPIKHKIPICWDCAAKDLCYAPRVLCGEYLGSGDVPTAASRDKRKVVERYTVQITIPGKKEEFMKYYNAANDAIVNKNYQEALDNFKKCNEIIPNGCACQVGIALKGLERYEEALSVFDVAIKEDPTYYEAYYQKALVLVALGKNSEAEPLFKKTIDLNVPYGNAYLMYAYLLESVHQNFDQAITYYEKGFDLSPTTSTFRGNLINLYEKANRLEDALKQTELALKLNKNNSEYTNAKKVYLVKLGREKRDKQEVDNALIYYKRALEIDSKEIDALLGIADINFDKGNFEEAINYYLKSIEIDTKNTGINFQLGNCYSRLKQFNKAEEYYKKALSIDPKLVDVMRGLSNIYLDQGKWNEVIPIYKKLMAADPDNIKAYHYYLGLAQYQVKQFSDARDSWKNSIETDENKNLETYSCLAVCEMKLSNPVEAEKYCEKTLELLKNENSFVYYNLACAYSMMNKVDKSLDVLEKALKTGQINISYMEADADLTNVRATKGYKDLLAKYK